jgi:TonB family protein
LADGSTANARIIGSSPKGIFDDAVLAAIGRSTFEANSPRQQCPFHSQFNVR